MEDNVEFVFISLAIILSVTVATCTYKNTSRDAGLEHEYKMKLLEKGCPPEKKFKAVLEEEK